MKQLMQQQSSGTRPASQAVKRRLLEDQARQRSAPNFPEPEVPAWKPLG